MASPALIRTRATLQRRKNDCVTTCLSVLLDEPYRKVAIAAKQVEPHALEVGLDYKEAIQVAKKLGHVLVPTQPASLAGQTGILYVSIKGRYHAVILFHGIIIDPADGMIAIPDIYLASEGAKIIRLLVA